MAEILLGFTVCQGTYIKADGPRSRRDLGLAEGEFPTMPIGFARFLEVPQASGPVREASEG